MLKCAACGTEAVRRTADQRYCDPCRFRIEAQIAADARRNAPRWPLAKELR